MSQFEAICCFLLKYYIYVWSHSSEVTNSNNRLLLIMML